MLARDFRHTGVETMDPDVTYRDDKAFDLDAWLGLYHACDWNRDFTVRNLEAALSDAYCIVTAWRGEEMVGTVTILSDGLNYATFEDVVVHPEHRRRGIGSELMRRAIAGIAHIDPSVVKLNAVPGAEPFYEKLGFALSGEIPMYLKGSRRG
jgi:ribosomal protein S18 acetylase RimI-like enzyme